MPITAYLPKNGLGIGEGWEVGWGEGYREEEGFGQEGWEWLWLWRTIISAQREMKNEQVVVPV